MKDGSARVCMKNKVSIVVPSMDCPWQFLFPESFSSPLVPSFHPYPPPPSPLSLPSPSPPVAKTFVQALNNACDIPLIQLLIPCMKGDVLAVKIPEDEYK